MGNNYSDYRNTNCTTKLDFDVKIKEDKKWVLKQKEDYQDMLSKKKF